MPLSPVHWKELPARPGCYLFYGEEDEPLYIGKAKNIRKRVANYFQKKEHDAKTKALLNKIRKMEFIVTASETEAFILENTLIKKHQPHYNIDLKDAKQFAYLQMTDEPYPRLVLARNRQTAGKYFGPFTSAQERDDIHLRLVRIFRLRTCRRLPRRVCLRHHIGLCSSPCIGLITQAEYRNQAIKAVAVLRGRTREILLEMQEQMERFSRQLIYEEALKLRDQISSLKRLKEKQAVDRSRSWDEDVISYRIRGSECHTMVFHARRGMLTEKEEFSFAGDAETFEEFLCRYYSERPQPREIILPHKPSRALFEYLNRRKKILITVPCQGKKKELLDLVERNIESIHFPGERKLVELQERLNLERPPETIECFDISHISGSQVVGSMVQFCLGRPEKSQYRRFRIRTFSGSDDFAALAEIVNRRYLRLKEEHCPLPDLVIVDGGAGQLAAALGALGKLELRLPVIAIAKRLEEIYLPGFPAPLALPSNDPALLMIRAVRDEAHRFAIAYHRLLRSKAVFPRKPSRKKPPPA